MLERKDVAAGHTYSTVFSRSVLSEETSPKLKSFLIMSFGGKKGLNRPVPHEQGRNQARVISPDGRFLNCYSPKAQG